MSNFMPLVKKEYEFEDDTIKVSFKRLTRQQMIQLTPYFPKEGKEVTDEENFKFLDEASEILKVNISEISGLRDAEGNSLDLKEHLDDMHFMTLTMEIAMDLMKESMMDTKKQKSSGQEEPLEK